MRFCDTLTAMASLKILREEIQRTAILNEVMGTLEKIAGFERVKSQNFYTKIQEYENELNNLLKGFLPITVFPAQPRKNPSLLLLCFGPELGLTGSFGERTAEFLLSEAAAYKPANIIAVGHELEIVLRDKKVPYKIEYILAEGIRNSAEILETVVERVMRGLEKREFKEIVVASSRYRALGEYDFASAPIYKMRARVNGGARLAGEYVFIEPSLKKIIRRYLALLLKAHFSKPWHDVRLIEASLRLLETNRAKENAREVVGKLRRTFTRALRGKITRNINELFTGKEAFERRKRGAKTFFEYKI